MHHIELVRVYNPPMPTDPLRPHFNKTTTTLVTIDESIREHVD